jgi:hypothetical protein
MNLFIDLPPSWLRSNIRVRRGCSTAQRYREIDASFEIERGKLASTLAV